MDPNFTINRHFLECTSVESTLYKHWYFTVLIIRVDQTLGGPCTFTVGKLLFRQSEEGWACCTSKIVQTLVFDSRLPGLNRHWIDLVHPLSVNYFFHSRNKVGPLFPNIVPTLVINSRSPTSDQHLSDRHSRQSVMISAWVVQNSNLNNFTRILLFYSNIFEFQMYIF